MHSVWRRVRSPFHRIDCACHNWEIYGVQNAGCTLCGAEHACADALSDNKCPLVQTDEGGLCCTVTGYCLPILRLSDKEYVENVYFSPHPASNQATPIVADEISSVVRWFLMGKQSEKCKSEEVAKIIGKYQCALVKNFKQHKLSRTKDGPARRTCVLTIIAQSLHQVQPKHIRRSTPQLCDFCSHHIFRCLQNLKLVNIQNKKTNLVIGMLFLMKQGLVINNIQWLPRVAALQNCLPHETNLEKTFKLCMKLVCETENEIKLALRQRVQLT